MFRNAIAGVCGAARFQTVVVTCAIVGAAGAATTIFPSIRPDYADAHEAATGWAYPPACCHICLHPAEDRANCFFAPSQGV